MNNKDTYILKDRNGNKHTTHNLHEFFTERYGDGFIPFCINLRRHGEFKGWSLVEEILAEDKDLGEEKVKRFWKLKDTKGKIYTTDSLVRFCREHFKGKEAKYAPCGLTSNGKYKGWKILESHVDGEVKESGKFWKLRDPEGNEHTTNNLTKFFTSYFGDKAQWGYNSIACRGKYKGWVLLKNHKDEKVNG